MGLIKAIQSAIDGGLADQWLEVIEPRDMGDTTVMTSGVQARASSSRNSNVKGTDAIISNGSIIHVYPNQLMLLVDGGKIVDYTAEQGYYKVDQSSSPSLWGGEFADALLETFGRIKFGGIPSSAQKVYYINLQEIKGIKFGTRNPVNYFDNFYNAELFLRAFGSYSIKITNPLTFFAEAIPRNVSQVDITDINRQYLSEFMTAFQAAINQMSADGIRISYVASRSRELAQYMATALDEEWTRMRGMQVQSVGIDSISYSEESQALINLRNRGAMLQDSRIREGYVQGAVSRGLEAAGSNPGGATAGFVGMGIGMQGTGGFMGEASGTNRYQMMQDEQERSRREQAAAAAPAATTYMNADSWTCECGRSGSGRFCPECGKPRPEPASNGWTCSCGCANTGKFCTECGTKRPEAPAAVQCDKCGYKPADATGLKFCPECGDPIRDEDIVK